MKKSCSICQKSIRRLKQLDEDFYCSECLDKYCCTKCNRLHDGCVYCHKKLCDCVEYRVEYDYGGDLIFCKSCFELQDGESQLYFYFRDKYKEQLTLSEIQTIIKNNKSKQNN